MSRTEYLFGLDKDDFDTERHLCTGLIDIFEHPICKRQTPTKNYPAGFGRNKEWNEFERTTVSRTDIGAHVGFGAGSCTWVFEAGDFGLSETQLEVLGET